MTEMNTILKKDSVDGSFYLQDLLGEQLPTRKTENWKYNDVYFLKAEPFLIIDEALKPEKARLEIEKQTTKQLNHDLLKEENVIVFINSQYVASLSKLKDNNLTLTNTKELDDKALQNIADINQQYGNEKNSIASLIELKESHQYYLNLTADSKNKKPVYIIHYSSTLNKNNDRCDLSLNKLIINQPKSSETTIVEVFISSDDSYQSASQLAVQTTLVNIEENATLNHHRFNLELNAHKQIGNLTHLLNKNANLNSFLYANGSLLNKTDVNIINLGSGANSQTTGIYLPSEEQSIDYHTCIEHRVPHCNSKEILRGIIADKAKATFNGKIHIFKDAQKSDAQLSNKNLLLTNSAEINTKPELEIYADDVVCAHGATVAKIDDASIFYLKSRGIKEDKARAMISIGFIKELLSYVENDAIRTMLEHLIQKKLSSI